MGYETYKTLLTHLNTIDNYKTELTSKSHKIVQNKLYKYVKKIASFYYQERHNLPFYYQIIKHTLKIEESIKDNIIDISVPFSVNDEKDNFLDNLIHETRMYLLSIYYEDIIDDNLLQGKLSINLVNYCNLAADYIDKECQRNGIPTKKIYIAPGYEKNSSIYLGAGYHFINIIKYNGKDYLVDTTYNQFFDSKSNNLNRLGIPFISGCDVGTFMLMSKEGKQITNDLLQKGYTELDDKKIKTYLDAFTISYRNGLYYEKTNDFSYTTNYSVDDYVRFLNTSDSQIKHEGEELLGYQRRPLNNHKLSFKKRI